MVAAAAARGQGEGERPGAKVCWRQGWACASRQVMEHPRNRAANQRRAAWRVPQGGERPGFGTSLDVDIHALARAQAGARMHWLSGACIHTSHSAPRACRVPFGSNSVLRQHRRMRRCVLHTAAYGAGSAPDVAASAAARQSCARGRQARLDPGPSPGHLHGAARARALAWHRPATRLCLLPCGAPCDGSRSPETTACTAETARAQVRAASSCQAPARQHSCLVHPVRLARLPGPVACH